MPPHPKFGQITPDDQAREMWQFETGDLDRVELGAGITSWEALYHYLDKAKAAEIYDLVVSGYDDESPIDPEWWPEERQEFISKAWHLKRLLMDLEGTLWRKLRLGDLVAFGYSNLDSLDSPRREIRCDRWQDLDLDVRESIARGPGIEVTQILIYAAEPTPPVADKATLGAYSQGVLRRWYQNRIKTCALSGRRPSREDDYRDANAELPGKHPKRQVESLRRELAPDTWTQKGRRRPRKP